jgi:hypothetical protein
VRLTRPLRQRHSNNNLLALTKGQPGNPAGPLLFR